MVVFCEVCEMKVQEGGNYCYNCGAGVESFRNGKSKFKFASLDHNCEQNFNIAVLDSSLVIFLDPETLFPTWVQVRCDHNFFEK